MLYVVCFLSSPLLAQEEPNGRVNWLSFEEAQEKNKQVERPFLIDVYTDWCGWCKHMMKTTYSNPNIAAYINTNFYPVKFNAEIKDTIEFNGTRYKPTSKEPKTPHELAIKFLGSSLSYPSTIFVTNNFQYNLLTQGYLEDKKIEPLLVFMVENTWRTTNYDEFSKHFAHTFYDTAYPKVAVKRYKISEIESLQKKKAKKVLVHVNSPFCNTGRVMSVTSFVDTSVANYINKHFYLVDFDATTEDTLVFKNEKHYKVLVNNFPIHSLALKLTNNRFSLPALSILDETLTPIDVLNFYQSPENLKPILKYIGTNAYKTKTYPDFLSEKEKNTSLQKKK